jgi:DNA (cytosine-5)-methyltransferase 1
MYRPWSLRELNSIPWNGKTVFSAFSCGGGSTMGYELAGYQVIGNLEIDQKLSQMYIKNHHPQYPYTMDIREFLQIKNQFLPYELFRLDILDGSPPCSVFSLSGKRERDWGKSRQFREGQAKQRLDDLFIQFVRLIGKLKPKVFIAENVKGLIEGNARGYVSEILKKIDSIGYHTQIFCLNSAKMGVPQRRERVFFIGHKKELRYPPLKLAFHERPILFGEIRSEGGKPVSAFTLNQLKRKRLSDRNIGDINERERGKNSRFNSAIVWDNIVAPTITSGGEYYKAYNDRAFLDIDYINCQTFPVDYDFDGQSVQYVCGMSVPPIMMKRVSEEVAAQWLDVK